MLLLHPRDGRVFFVIPWLGKTLVGTTDTEENHPPEAVQATPEDLGYLLEGFNHHFRTPLQLRDVLGCFAGLRPLLRDGGGSPSARSREWKLFTSPSGLLTVAGGKYTTYRHMAEVITDTVVKRLGIRRRERTRLQSLDGSPPGPWSRFRDETISDLTRGGLPEPSALHLVHRYGRHAADVAEYVQREPALARPIHPEEPDLCAELVYQRDNEMALFPADFLLRRTRIGLFHPERLAAALAS